MMSEVPSLQSDTDSRSVEDQNAPETSGPGGLLPPARLGHSLLIALRALWDRLGFVLAVSLTGSIVLLLSLSLGLLTPHALPVLVRSLIGVAIAVIALSPLLAASYDSALRIASRREITLPGFLLAVRQFRSVAIRLGMIHLFVGLIVAVNVSFYLTLRAPVWRAVEVICLYFALSWCAMALYQGPLLILQETGAFDEPQRRAKRGAFAVIRRSFFLVLGEPLFSAGLAAAVLLWTAVTTLTAVGTVMCWLGGVCVLTTLPTLALLVKYGVVQPVDSLEDPPMEEA